MVKEESYIGDCQYYPSLSLDSGSNFTKIKLSAQNIAAVVFYMFLIYILFQAWNILMKEPTAFEVKCSLSTVHQENFKLNCKTIERKLYRIKVHASEDKNLHCMKS